MMIISLKHECDYILVNRSASDKQGFVGLRKIYLSDRQKCCSVFQHSAELEKILCGKSAFPAKHTLFLLSSESGHSIFSGSSVLSEFMFIREDFHFVFVAM